MTCEVTINQGTLRGSQGTDFRGNPFLKFQGIPYAKPPLGELRFKAPQPPEEWFGVLDASKEGDVCISRDPLKHWEVSGSENCLFLNVYTSRLPKGTNNLKPVLFWIHGGGFVFGSGNEDLYGPQFLLTQEIVLVTINYRLGLLGFLSFEDPSLEIPGNAGLKDQVMALKWVRNNISKFGGDPHNVTIFGESAGGSSVHLLMLAPMAKGLFHKAIAQSGCALNPWVQGTRGSKLVGEVLGVQGDKAIYEELMKKSVEELYEIQEKLVDNGVPNEQRPLGLVVERNSKEPFLDKDPLEVMKSGDFSSVPFMIGYTSSEGMIFELHKKPGQPEMLPIEKVIPWFFECQTGTPETQTLASKIRNFYFEGEEYSRKFLTKKYEMFSDGQFLHGIYSAVRIHYLKNPLYFYRMSVESDLNFMKKILKIEVPGSCHTDDIGYLFKHVTTPEIKPGSLEAVSIARCVKLWTNFAKFGNPTPEKDPLLNIFWKTAGPSLELLDIGEELRVVPSPDLSRVDFWNRLFEESPRGQNLNHK